MLAGMAFSFHVKMSRLKLKESATPFLLLPRIHLKVVDIMSYYGTHENGYWLLWKILIVDIMSYGSQSELAKMDVGCYGKY